MSRRRGSIDGRVCLRLLGLLLSGIFLLGCRLPTGDRHHLVVLDRNGLAIDPARTERSFLVGRGYPHLAGPQVDEYLRHLEGSIREYARRQLARGVSPRVVLFVNGGLNGIENSIERSNELTDRILGDPDEPGYPVFLAWDSDLFTSWFQDTFVVRRGRRDFVLGPLTAPIYIAEDLVQGLIHAPQDCLYYDPDTYMRGYYDYSPRTISSSHAVATTLAREAHASPAAGPRGDTVQFEDDPGAVLEPYLLTRVWHWIAQLVHLPLNVFVDGMGTSAWDEMERRTRLLFDSEAASLAGTTDMPAGTALVRFLGVLGRVKRGCPELAIDLYCHSMGCMVGNRMLELAMAVDCDQCVPPFRDIVYMGAACTVADYEATIFPYLKLEQEEDTHFYHVTLHERMESRESHWHTLMPYGSLLTWIDNYYARTRTPMDLVIGRFTNLMNSYGRTPYELRDRIHIRSYGLDSRGGEAPIEHGDFDDCAFWRASFYVPDGQSGWDPDDPD